MTQFINAVTVGSSQTVADELLAAVNEIFHGNIKAAAVSIEKLTVDPNTDLYIALPTRVEQTAKIVPREKILSLELVPNSKFFVSIAKIPSAEKVIIFNNNTAQGNKIKEYCLEQGIDHLTFDVVAFAELSKEEVAGKLRNAKYIIGANTIVGKDGELGKYSDYLHPDVKIIPANRMPTFESTKQIMEYITLYNYRKVSRQVSQVCNHLNHEIQNIVSITNEVAASIEATSGTIQEVSSKMDEEANNVNETLNSAKNLTEATNKIGSFVDTIKHISGQTNLLALNAAIEAARAGEQGRGFAVVAQEVRKLAEESRSSVETIRSLMGGIFKVVEEIGPSLQLLTKELLANRESVNKISLSAIKEKEGINKINQNLQTINSTSQELVESIKNLLQ
ncbi:MAG: methyl-accepting chemotaxis protein [Bacillota bacterium]